MAQWSAYLDGSGDYITCGDVATGTASAITVEMWIKVDGAIADTCPLAVKTSEWELSIDADFQLTFAVWTNSGKKTASDGTILSADTWYHVVGFFAGSKVGLAVDGALVGSSNATPGATIDNTANVVTLGRIADGAGGYWYMTGWIAYLRISDVQRYGSFPYAIPRLPHFIDDSDTLCQLDFTEGTGSSIKNRAAAATTYDGSIAGGRAWSLDIPSSKWGSAYETWGDEWVIKVDGTDRTDNVALESISITDEIGARSTAVFRIEDTAAITVTSHDAVQIWRGGSILFSGVVAAYDMIARGVRYDIVCHCVDWSYLLDARIVEGEMIWSGETARTIVLACFNTFGWSILFDGTTDGLVDCGTHGTSFFTGSFTLECWFRCDTLPGVGDRSTLVGRWEVTNGYGYQWKLSLDSAGKVSFVMLFDTGGGYSVEGAKSTTTIVEGTWYHVAGVWDGSECRIYVDGTEEDSSTPAAGTPFNESTKIWLGGRYDGNAEDAFVGAMNWMRISNNARYTGAFTPADGCPATDGNTVTLYDMQEGRGTTLDNLNGTAARDGTLDTGVTWTPEAHYGTESFCSEIEAVSSALTNGHVHQGATNLTWAWNWQYISDILDELARISDYAWYVRQMEYGTNPKVLFFVPQSQDTLPFRLNTSVDLTASPPEAPMRLETWSVTGNNIRNYIVLKDGDVIYREDATSQSAFGVLKMLQKVDAGLADSFVEDIGDGLLAHYAEENVNGRVLFWQHGARVGHRIYITHSVLSIEANYLITRLQTTPLGGGVVEYVAQVEGQNSGRRRRLQDLLRETAREIVVR